MRLKSVRQSIPGYCGPASLESLLNHYGIKLTQDEIAKLCRATAEHGTSPRGISAGLKKLGFKARIRRRASWRILKEFTEKGVPVLVGWFSDYSQPGGEHYSVAYKVTDKEVFLMDPELGGTHRILKDSFLRAWRRTPPVNWLLTIENQT